jgi:hypothetical protein
MTETDIARSNSLTDLAARIRAEHEATALSLKRGLEHSMTAGQLLIEAKALLKHGQWLPWLRDLCAISERTAQLYMRLAKNRDTIEKKNPQPIADLTMNEAAALLALSVGVEKLLKFASEAALCEGDGEALVKLATEHGFGVTVDEWYDPFHGTSDPEKRDWLLFGLALGGGLKMNHVEWCRRNGWNTVDEWLGAEGDAFRQRWRYRDPEMAKLKAYWKRFRGERAHMSLADVEAELQSTYETGEAPC